MSVTKIVAVGRHVQIRDREGRAPEQKTLPWRAVGGYTHRMTLPDSPDDPTDEILAAHAARRWEGDLQKARAACQQLYGRHARRLLAFLAARVNRNDLEDVHHGVWVRVWEHLPDSFDGTDFRAWLYQIARNLVIDHFRRRHAESLASTEELPDPRPGGQPLTALLEEERRLLLERCLKRLDARLAELVRGRLGGENYGKLCPRLGLKPAQGHKLFHSAKAALQECVNKGEA
jgi:RNA polymerase sigma-70 factor (ECF subfamily)